MLPGGGRFSPAVAQRVTKSLQPLRDSAEHRWDGIPAVGGPGVDITDLQWKETTPHHGAGRPPGKLTEAIEVESLEEDVLFTTTGLRMIISISLMDIEKLTR